ncbi:DNA repair protein RecO [Neptunicella sp. SCSIO 80796]|uniref:DNA repair protein RecO n=1 Tax=Neptunicella plasticusilytica TaxID=3117012 RepID=UPI003A4D735E
MLNGINAFILHKREYRETSYLVDAFSAEYGKLSFVAKGVRSSKSHNKSLLQPFQPLELTLYGKHELKNLSVCEANGKAYQLLGKALYSGLYLNELINRLLHSEYPYADLFELYRRSIQQLALAQPIEPILRCFEFGLLADMGYALNFDTDGASGESIQPAGYYQWIEEQGFIPLAGPMTSRNCFSGSDLLAIAGQQWQQSSLSCAKIISRMALQPLLGSKPLKSRELFMREKS